MTNQPSDSSAEHDAKVKVHSKQIQHHIEHISSEFKEGFEFIGKYPKSVSIFGASLAKEGTDSYKNAELLGKRIVTDLKYAVITGGGPGIMQAANKGAREAGGDSLGLCISLPHERFTNAYVSDSIRFSYFFARKTLLAFTAEAYVFFPGGFGTLDELFNILTLVQTGKIPRIPIVLFDSGYWNDMQRFFSEKMIGTYGSISEKELRLFEITDSIDRTIEIIKGAQVYEWWRNIN